MWAGTASLPILAQGRGAQKPLVLLDSSREQDGLRGPVRRVKSEVARLRARGNEVVEASRRLLEVTVYDAAGRRVENRTYPVVVGAAGEESNVYDERGNLTETVQRDASGAVIGRTVYSYEFDDHGNWTMALASSAVDGPDGRSLEPLEVTYRAITYYPSSDDSVPASVAAKVSEEEEVAPARPQPSPAVAAATEVGEINDKALTLPPPAYPLGRKPESGPVSVEVEVVVDETGRVVSAKAARGPRLLREAAEMAARAAIFLPFRTEGRPARVKGTLRYTFPYLP